MTTDSERISLQSASIISAELEILISACLLCSNKARQGGARRCIQRFESHPLRHTFFLPIKHHR